MGNYFSNLFASKRSTNTVVAPKDSFNEAWMNYYSLGTNANVNLNEVDKINTVYTCIKILSENISRLDINLKHNVSGIKTNYKQHPYYYLLKYQPNTYQSIETFLQILTTQLYLKGNAFVWKIKEKGRVVGLEIIETGYITDAIVNKGKLWYYAKSDDKFYPADSLLHFKLPVNKNGYFATNPIEALRLNINIGFKSETTVDNLYTNNAQSPLVLETTADQSNKKIDEALEIFKKKYSGFKNAGNIIVPPPLTTLKELKISVEDAKFLQSSVHSEQTIASAFGVPVSMLGHSDNKFANFQESALNFKQNTMSALMNIFLSELNFKLLEPAERMNDVEFDFDAEQLIDTNLIEKANVHKILKDAGAMSVNEMARKWNLEGVKNEYGDMHYMQSQYIPLEKYEQYASNKPQQQFNNIEEEKKEI